MEGWSRRSSFYVAASLLGLAGVLAGLMRPPLPAAAEDPRTLQVWPDRSMGIASGPLEGSTAQVTAQVFPFGVSRTTNGDIVWARTYLHFPLDVLPPGAEVLYATLHVYVDSSSGMGETRLGAYRVLEPWRAGDWSDDPVTWPGLLTSPIAVRTARFGVPASPRPTSPPTPTATPTLTSTPTLTATETSMLFSKPAGHALIQGPGVTLDPLGSQVGVGATTAVDIRIENVTDLRYAAVYLLFDPALLEVVDDDPTTAGVQIQPGSFLGPDFVEENIVYSADGEIDFRAASDRPVNGSGVLATITFRGKSPGISGLRFDAVFLENDDEEPIGVDEEDGSVTVTGQDSPTPTPPTSLLPTPTPPTSLLPTPTMTPPPALTPTATPATTLTPTPPARTPSAPLPSPSPAGPGVALGPVTGIWLTWDVTALMRAWLTGEVADDGLALASAPEPNADPETAGDLLIARQRTADDPNTRPYVVVGFRVQRSTPTPAPALPLAGRRSGWGTVGLLLIGAAMLILGLAVRHERH
jgi:hypothetical protein